MKINQTLIAALGLTLAALALPVVADPPAERKEFQDYYKKRFADIPTDEFANGLYALFPEYRKQWESLNEFPPYELGLERGKLVWDKPFKNGKKFADCFPNGGRKIAQHYPKWDEAKKELRTAELDLIDCAKANGENPPWVTADLNKDQKARVDLAELTAHLYSLSKGERIDIDLSAPGARAAYEQGKTMWWSRRGQLNFACYHCHMENAGKDLGGNQPLSAGFGHTTGWPSQRLEWGRIETIHQRYATCFSQVRAKPYKHNGPEYRALQLYETYNSSGLPLTAPAMRN